MTDKQINVPSKSIDYLLDMIENRILEIGKTYTARGQGLPDDSEIADIRALARQLGVEFVVKTAASGFAVTRREYPPVD